jgi:hypothetical protein
MRLWLLFGLSKLSTMPNVTSNIDLGKSWEQGIMEIIPDLMYTSYATQRDNGMTHEQCLSIGLGNDSYNDRYNKERDPDDLKDVRFGIAQ